MSSSARAGGALSWTENTALYDREEMTRSSITDKQQLYNNDTDSTISDDDFSFAITLIQCGIFPVLNLVGLPANIINMVVFYRQGLRDKMNLCLFTLAFADFMFLICMLLLSSYCPVAIFSEDIILAKFIKLTILKNTVNFQNAFIYSSGTLTAIIATERCICVVWPLKSTTIFKYKTMALMIFAIIVAFNVLCVLYTLKHVVRWTTDETGNLTVFLDDTDLYINNKFAFQVVRDGILPAISFGTFFIISFVTVVTVRKLKTAMDWRQKTSSNVMDKRQMTLVKILITVSCVYIVCNFPKVALDITKFLSKEFSTLGEYGKIFDVGYTTAFSILMINSSVNCFIYIRQSSRFREELRACFLCKSQQD